MTTKVTKRRSTEVRQRQIINAAREIIVNYGSENVTVGRIANAVAISEAAIYRHFKSKKAILTLLIDDVEDRLIADFSAVSTEGKTPLEIIEGGLKGPLSERRRGVSFQVIAEIISLGDKKLNKKISEFINAYIAHLADLLSQGIKSGEVREDVDVEAAATLLFGMIQGLVSIWALSGYRFDAEAKYDTLWRVFRDSVTLKKERQPAQPVPV
ncbi:MAG: TetR/AcrR family transcriptional regulator [Chloroflexi bacterium]|nr:TetR/AcrR family transcriptional regulator [Chloroflexota bacterium]